MKKIVRAIPALAVLVVLAGIASYLFFSADRGDWMEWDYDALPNPSKTPDKESVSAEDHPSSQMIQKVFNLNTATLLDLMNLPNIGEAKAKRILDYREEHGAFTCIEEIMKVSGIGEKTFEKIRDYITVTDE